MDQLGKADVELGMKATSTIEDAEVDGLKDATAKSDAKAKPQKLPSVSYFELYRYADRTDKILIAVGFFCACAKGAVLPLFTIIFGKLLNTFGTGTAGGTVQQLQSDLSSKINQACLYYVYLAIASGVVAYGEVSCWMLSSTRQARRIKEKYLLAVLRQDVAFFDQSSGSAGDLTSSINEDTLAVQAAIGDKVGNAISNLAQALTGFAVAFSRGWSMTLVILATIPLLAGAGAFIASMAGRLESSMTNSYADANLYAEESVGNMRTVSAFNGQQKTIDEYGRRLEEPERVQIKGGVLSGALMGIIQAIMFFTYALALWYGSTRVIAREYNGGQVATVLFSAIIGGFALGMSAPALQQIVAGRAAFARLKKIYDRKPVIDMEDGGEKPPSAEGHIELKAVSFVYPTRPEAQVLSNFSMQVPAGSSFALCGSSGSGKSTVIQLLERFYDPTSGQIFLDGRDIKGLDLQWYRSHVGLVSQEPTLFATDIWSNIAYGRPGATQADVEHAASVANAHAFISALPLGYRTSVGEKGVQLSGGQKQRIAIARAVLKNPKVLLCDEATSALDNKSERVVQLALERLGQGRTTITVAHRLSTIIHANQIAVVSEGQIIEQGTHSELIAKQNGAYSVLVGLQMSALGEKMQDRVKEESEVEEPAVGTPLLKKLSSKNLEASDVEVHIPWWKKLLGSSKDADQKKLPKVEAGFGRLAKYNRPEWPFFILGAAGSAILGAIFPFFALALSSILGAFFSTDEEHIKSQTRLWCGVFIAVGGAGFIGGGLQSYCFTLMGARLTRRVRTMLMGSLMRQEMAFFDKEENTSGALVARLGVDSTSIRGAVGDQVGILAQNMVTFVAGYIIAFISSWKMSLVITSVLPLLIVASIFETRFMKGFANEASQMYNQANQMASDAFGSCRTVAAFNLRQVIHQAYSQLLDAPEERMRRRAYTSGIGYGASQFIMFSVYALGFWYGGTLVVKGELTLAQMLKVFFAILLAAMGISQARVAFPDLSKAAGAVPRVFSVIDRKSEIDSFDESGERPEHVKGELTLTNVEFFYPERPTITVFKGFDLLIEQGKVTALCGQSGSGKSSIVGLVLRFYDPLQGSVSLDGVDLRKLNLQWLRRQMSLVGQEPHLFTGTIRDNIVYGRDDATEEDIVGAAKAANAWDFITKAPAGLDTLVGQNGIQLSGGQRQRIAIARSVIRQPKVLLLDEATSALDATSERVVQEALDRIQGYCTTLVIAHRLSTIRNADKIAVLQEGQILEQGSHQELVQRPDGAYRALISQQQNQT